MASRSAGATGAVFSRDFSTRATGAVSSRDSSTHSGNNSANALQDYMNIESSIQSWSGYIRYSLGVRYCHNVTIQQALRNVYNIVVFCGLGVGQEPG